MTKIGFGVMLNPNICSEIGGRGVVEREREDVLGMVMRVLDFCDTKQLWLVFHFSLHLTAGR